MMREITQHLIKRTSVFVALVLLTCAGVVAASGQERGADANARPAPHKPRGGRGGDDSLRLLRILSLTPEQRAQIKAIRRETEPEVRLFGGRLREARRALDEAIYSDNLEESIVEERAREVGSALAAAVRLRALTELKIRRVLTPEQLATFRELQNRARTRQRPDRRSPGANFFGDAPGRFGKRVPHGASSRRQF